MRIQRWLACVLVGFSFLAHAQSNHPTAAHIASIKTMLKTLGFDRLVSEGMQQGMAAAERTDPDRAAFLREIIAAVPMETILDRLAPLYAPELTREQADAVTAFIRTGAGRKTWAAAISRGGAKMEPLTAQEKREAVAFEKTDAARAFAKATDKAGPLMQQAARELMFEVIKDDLKPFMDAAAEVRRERDEEEAAIAAQIARFDSFKFLNSTKLQSEESIVAAQRRIDDYETLITGYIAQTNARADKARAKLEAAAAKGRYGASMKKALDGEMRKVYDLHIRFAENQTNSIATFRRYLAFLAERRGTYRVEDGQLVFERTEDLAAYRELQAQLREVAAVAGSLEGELAERNGGPRTLEALKMAPIVVKIGHGGPLRGNLAGVGLASEKGARLAIEEANRRPTFIKGAPVKFELVSEDDDADARKASEAARKLVNAKVVGVVGHSTTAASIAAARVYGEAGIPMISPSATNLPLTRQGSKLVFRAIATDAQQHVAFAHLIAEDPANRRIAIFRGKTDYDKEVAQLVKASLLEANVQVVGDVQPVNGDPQNLGEVVQKIRAAKADAVFFAADDFMGGELVKQMRKSGVNVPVYQGEAACSIRITMIAGAAAEKYRCPKGGLDPSLLPQDDKFRQAFEAAYGAAPTYYAAHAYDAATMLIKAMKMADSTDPKIFLPELAKMRHVGVTGRLEFTDRGDLKVGTVSVMEVKDGKLAAATTRTEAMPAGE